jgi:hypothetical protein
MSARNPNTPRRATTIQLPPAPRLRPAQLLDDDVEKGMGEKDDMSALPRTLTIPRTVTIQDADWPGPHHERELRRFTSQSSIKAVDGPSRMIGEFR